MGCSTLVGERIFINITILFIKLDRPKSLILVGPTRLGKTRWARSLGKHIYWCNSPVFSSADFLGALYVVVDDVPWEYFKCKKQLLGGQKEFTVTEKYQPLMEITFGKPVIYLCNEDPRKDMKDYEVEYYGKNVIYVFIENKLF